jgi:hypothetical protein
MYPSMRGKLRGGLPFHAIEERISRLDQLGSVRRWSGLGRARERMRNPAGLSSGGRTVSLNRGVDLSPRARAIQVSGGRGKAPMERISGLRFRTRLLAEPEDEFTSAAQDRYLFARLV